MRQPDSGVSATPPPRAVARRVTCANNRNASIVLQAFHAISLYPAYQTVSMLLMEVATVSQATLEASLLPMPMSRVPAASKACPGREHLASRRCNVFCSQ
ncbi:hypothetical protein MRB53_037579 [Persea americana]|nr:hypothetical protein MRB53_037579 [Persea americana]